MNKKILSIIFTLFLAGLLSISCSNKDKTGPGDNGAGSTTIPENGTGINKSYRVYKFAPTESFPFILTDNNSQTQNLTSADNFQLSTSSKDANLQGANEGGILVKMPLLKTLGFTSDIIRIPPKNIVEGSGSSYTIHTSYIIDENPDNLITVELKSSKFNLTSNIEMDITLTKTTKVKDQEPKVETYNLKTTKATKFYQSNAQVTAIEGIVIDPKY